MNINKMKLELKNIKDSLFDKEKMSSDIISEALSKAKAPYCIFTGELGSLVLLHLIRRLQDGSINLPVLHIDTTVEFPEIYQFIDKMRKLWGFRLLREKNDEALRTITIAEDKELCCRLLKTEALMNAINKYGIDYLFLAKRWNEQAEDPFFSIQGKCSLVNPLSHFSEEDTWDYAKKYNLPCCTFYERVFKKNVCFPCTGLLLTQGNKFQDESQHEKEKVSQKLKHLGYL
jgi:phosphoadenosine phosphosulfate reductase